MLQLIIMKRLLFLLLTASLVAFIAAVASIRHRAERQTQELESVRMAWAAEKAALEAENHRLCEALENEEQLRAQALARIDAVLRNIQEHDSVE